MFISSAFFDRRLNQRLEKILLNARKQIMKHFEKKPQHKKITAQVYGYFGRIA
jgi:hypothetical protein